MSTGAGQKRTRAALRRPALLSALAVTGLAAGLALRPCPSLAQQEPAKRDDAARRLESSKESLQETQRRAKTIQADVQTLNAEQARLNEQLIETGRLAQASEARLTSIEQRLSELDAQEKLLRGSLAARHQRIASMFSAMQRMGRNPPPVIVTRREDALQMVRSAMLMARAFPELKTQADALARQLDDLNRVVRDAREESERLKTESARLTETRTRIATLVESKRRTLSERQKELEDVRRTAAEISRSVTELGDLVARLDKLERTVAERTGLGAYEQELREREAREQEAARLAAAQPAPAQPAPAQPGSPPAGPPPALRPAQPSPDTAPPPTPDAGTRVAALPPPRVSLEPQTSLTSAGRMKPAIPFHLAKGRLPMPAQGRRVLAFGEKNQFGRTSRGIVIETRHSASVVSPVDGWVVYAGEFRTYGQVLIINAGGGYHILLANLARADVEVGRFVLAGEPVGAMSSNVGARNQDAAPVLYVEFRNKDGQSIDPTPWWADGTQKVQG